LGILYSGFLIDQADRKFAGQQTLFFAAPLSPRWAYG